MNSILHYEACKPTGVDPVEYLTVKLRFHPTKNVTHYICVNLYLVVSTTLMKITEYRNVHKVDR